MPLESATQTVATECSVLEQFGDYDLDQNLLRGIYSFGIEKPCAFQQRCIKPILDGRDTIGQAPSGTGRMEAFVIGALQRIDMRTTACQALMVAPTRELANQIQAIVLVLGRYMQVRCHACVVGASVCDDCDHLRSGQHVVVGTPARVFDLISKRSLVVDNLVTFMVDEADRMFSHGLQSQIFKVFKVLPPNLQICLFSATLSPDIEALTTTFLPDAVWISVEREESAPASSRRPGLDKDENILLGRQPIVIHPPPFFASAPAASTAPQQQHRELQKQQRQLQQDVQREILIQAPFSADAAAAPGVTQQHRVQLLEQQRPSLELQEILLLIY